MVAADMEAASLHVVERFLLRALAQLAGLVQGQERQPAGLGVAAAGRVAGDAVRLVARIAEGRFGCIARDGSEIREWVLSRLAAMAYCNVRTTLTASARRLGDVPSRMPGCPCAPPLAASVRVRPSTVWR